MAALTKTAAALLALSTAVALNFEPVTPEGWTREGDHILDNSHRDSKPGSPADMGWRSKQPNAFALWQVSLGDRLLEAASAHDAMEKCGGFVSFGDYTWCKKAMPREANQALKQGFRAVHDYTIDDSVDLTNLPSGDSFLALSFGVEESDCYSELMSSLYHVKSEIFDCYYSGKNGPLANDWHGNHSRANPCRERHCYTEEYHKNRVCLDDTSDQSSFTDVTGRHYQSLSKVLEGRAPLSTFVKIDIEGSEWGALERLLDNEEDAAKIRTLDMEIHFNMQPRVSDSDKGRSTGVSFLRQAPTQADLTRNVEIMERLAKKFAVTGSTLEHKMNDAGRLGEFARDTGKVNIVNSVGYDLDQYCISFVNRALL